MKYLLDSSESTILNRFCDLVAGQLLTPLTNYKNWGGLFAIDNGGFSGFDALRFGRMLERNREHAKDCLFVAVPDVVANARRTLELFNMRHEMAWIPSIYPVALVAQDGIESLEIPWSYFDAIFIGGGDPWKDSTHAKDVVRTAKILGKHVHVGRVNSPKRFKVFHDLGADTCDGTGVVKYSDMLEKIKAELCQKSDLFLELQEATP